MKLDEIAFVEDHPILAGIGLFLVTLGIALLLPDDWALDLFASLLALIGAIYVGMAVVQKKQIAFQFIIALGFLTLGLLGTWISAWYLVVGYFAHGLWDWLHHGHRMPVKLTTWYPPFCIVYDWLVGAAILILWL